MSRNCGRNSCRRRRVQHEISGDTKKLMTVVNQALFFLHDYKLAFFNEARCGEIRAPLAFLPTSERLQSHHRLAKLQRAARNVQVPFVEHPASTTIRCDRSGLRRA